MRNYAASTPLSLLTERGHHARMSNASRLRRALAYAGVAAMLAAPAAAATAQTVPQPRLPVVALQAGIHVIHAEVAATPATRAAGLMMRERLGPNEGMLFVFQDKAQQCFWMRNTLIPLSIAFLDDDGRIVSVADMAPRSDDSHCSARPVRFALEMEQGWFARRALGGGAQLLNPKVFPGQVR